MHFTASILRWFLITCLLNACPPFAGRADADERITITNPASGSYPYPVRLRVSIQIVGIEDLARVDLYLDDAVIGSKTNAPYDFLWITHPFHNDPYIPQNLIAVGCLGSGICVTSQPVTIRLTYDPPHPTVRFVKPLSTVSLLVGEPLPVQATVQMLGEDYTPVLVYSHNSILGTADWPEYAVTLTNLTEGLHPLELRYFDSFNDGDSIMGPTVQVGRILVSTDGIDGADRFMVKVRSIYTNGIITLERSADFAAWVQLTNAAAGSPFLMTLPIEERFRFYRASWKP